MDIYDFFYKEYLKLNPFLATFEGVHDYDHLLENEYSIKYHKSIIKLYKKYYSKFKENNLDLECDIIKNEIEKYEEYLDSPYKYYCLKNDSNVFNNTMFLIKDDRQIISSQKDLDIWKKRISCLGGIVNSQISLLKEGIKKGYTAHADIVKIQIDSLNSDKKYENYSLPNKNKIDRSLVEKYDNFMKSKYISYIDKLTSFLSEEYIKHCGDKLGCSKELYQIPFKMHNSVKISFEEIHDIGIKEVRRIRNNITKVFKKLNFNGTINEFYDEMMKDKTNFYDSPEEVINEYKNTEKVINDTVIQNNFYPYNVSNLEIKRVPKYKEKNSPMAFYISETEKIDGTFYLNLNDIKSHPKMDVESLFLHEALPGHHYQISIHDKLENSKFFKIFYFTDYLEGWATYAENLGEYKDNKSLLGKYFLEIFRAVRLVVDTGIHYYDWDYQKCFKYMRRYTCLTDDDIKNEIYRYTTYPGQALSYKIGELEFKRLKKVFLKNNKDLNIKDFHHEILKYGPIPLNILSSKIK